MFLSNVKLTTVLGAAFVAVLPLGFSGQAAADPGPGLRWSDIAWGSRGTQPRRAMMSYTYPRSFGYSYGYYPVAQPAVVWSTPVAPSTAAAPATVAIRGPDGVVRTFPVEGGAVQQQVALPGQVAQSFVSVQGPDGVVRSYPVASSPAAVPGQVIVGPGQLGAAPVITMPCR
jgi:hypothetical protein